MNVHILDDWFDTLRRLPSFEKLAGHNVTVWNDHVEDLDVLAERLSLLKHWFSSVSARRSTPTFSHVCRL